MGEGEHRLADADREEIVDQLRRHCADGRITLDELAERSEVVYRARTPSDLRDVLADLPPLRAAAAAEVPPARAPARGRKLILALMSAAKRRGRWRVDQPITAVAFWGAIDLDLRGAQIEVPVVDINAWAIMGSVEVCVPEGIPVELDGIVVMGARDDRTRDVPSAPGAPLVRITAYGLWGAVKVVSKRPGEKGFKEALREQIQQQVTDHVTQARHAARPPRPPWPAPPSLPGRADPDDRIPEMPVDQREAAHVARSGRRTRLPAAEALIDAVSVGDVAPPDRDLPRGTVTILFTDIAASTEIAERLGDQRWIGVLQAHNALVREQLARHGGSEVKVHGDGFMAVFPSARAGLLCAIGIQRAMAGYRAGHPDTPIDVRIGLHTGEVVEEGGDYFGRNVILAARIASHAAGGEILASALVKELTDSSGDLGFDDGVDVELKGLSRPWRVHRVEWA